MASILKRQRAIQSGPGAKEWAFGMTDAGRILRVRIRGLESDCECRHLGDGCTNCREGQEAYLRIFGTFDPGGDQKLFIFWAILAQEEKTLAATNLRGGTDYWWGAEAPPEAQVIFGWYSTRSSKDSRGWIMPCPHSIRKLFLLFHGTDQLKRSWEDPSDLEDARARSR